jgi:hypothetical protein
MAMTDWREKRGLELGLIDHGLSEVHEKQEPTVTYIGPETGLSLDDLTELARLAKIGANVIGYLVPDRDDDGYLIPVPFGPISRLEAEIYERRKAKLETLAEADRQANEDSD